MDSNQKGFRLHTVNRLIRLDHLSFKPYAEGCAHIFFFFLRHDFEARLMLVTPRHPISRSPSRASRHRGPLITRPSLKLRHHLYQLPPSPCSYLPI